MNQERHEGRCAMNQERPVNEERYQRGSSMNGEAP